MEFRYEKYHVHHGGDEEERKANYTDMVRKLSSAYIDDWHETSKDYSSIYCDVVVGYLQSNDFGYLLNDYIYKISFLHFHLNFLSQTSGIIISGKCFLWTYPMEMTLKDKPYASLSLM